MALTTEQRQQITFFTGKEVEHTDFFGYETLFVVGTPDFEDIIKRSDKITVVYLGTSQSFNPQSKQEWDTWDKLITNCLEAGFIVTLDLDVRYADNLKDYHWASNNKFVPMISVKLPNIDRLNKNTCIKLDDTTWGYSNKGVWTHKLRNLKDVDVFTPWEAYSGDN